MAIKKVRNMKVYEQSGYNYKATPTITLKGQWLKDAGFDIGDSITVTCEDGKLIITPVKWYRVRKSWSDAKSQKGAYKVLKNAKACADKNEGYSVFDWNGKVVYSPLKSSEPEQKKVSYRVRVSIKNLNIRKGPGTNFDKTGKYTGIGVFTIVAEADGEGATKWGKLKSGVGWISLDYAKRI